MESGIENRESRGPDAALRWAGHAFILFGLSSPLSSLVVHLTGGPDRFDLGFIFQILIGAGILRGGRTSWRLALLLCIALSLGGILVLVLSLSGHAGSMTVLGVPNPAPDLAALACVLFLALGLPLLWLLLRGDPRHRPPPSPAAPLSGRGLTAFYVVGLLVLAPAGASMATWIRRETTGVSTTTIRRADGRLSLAASLRVGDGGNPASTAVALWVVHEKAEIGDGAGPEAPGVQAGRASFKIPPPQSWIFIRPIRSKRGEPNIVLVGEDGREVRVPRRITATTEPAVMAAVAGFTDLVDLERRILGALPPE